MERNIGRNTSPRRSKRALSLIFAVMLMDVIGLSLIFPVAPYIVERYSSDALMVTMLSVIYAAAQFLAAPALGKISDRVGRRPVLLISVLGSAVGYFIFGLAGALWVLFAARLLDGITGGNISTAMAYIADVSSLEERPKNFILVGMAYGMGFVLGPALGGALGQISLNAPVFAAGTLSMVSVSLIYFLLPESLPARQRGTKAMSVGDFNPLGSISYMLKKPMLGQILVVYALFNLTFDGVNSTTGVFVSRKFLAQPWQLGLLFVVSGIALGLVQAAVTQRAVGRFGAKGAALLGLSGNALGGLMMFAAPALWMLYPVTFLSGSLTGLIWSPMATLTTNQVPEHEQGQLAGVNAALGGLMAAIGPLWAGFAYDHVMAGSPYWIGALITGCACLLLSQLKTIPQPEQLFGARSAAD